MRLRSENDVRWDLVALGEVMLRLDPGERTTSSARVFGVNEGGGEYNVARGLRRCFGHRTAIVTALVDNNIGRLVEGLMLQGGVDTRYQQWVEFDGIGRTARNGLNFTERGYGLRAAKGCSDRANTAVSQLTTGQVDWERIFGVDGSRWFHTGGIMAALGTHTSDAVEEALIAARRHGTVVSYDLNYRASLWEAIGGRKRSREVNQRLIGNVDVLIGNEEDFSAALGFDVEGLDEGYRELDPSRFLVMAENVLAAYPNVKVVGVTLRSVTTASRNDWQACALGRDDGFFASRSYNDLEILDRVGGGDSFAAGLIDRLMANRPLAEAVEYGAAHGALAMTTPGDTSTATRADVERVVAGEAARVAR
jgi:2-dehydro-3-deoxygluconokinase